MLVILLLVIPPKYITGMCEITDIGGITSSSITSMGGITNMGGMIIH